MASSTVVSTRKDSGLMALKLLLCREVDGGFQPTGNYVVAADAVGAGIDELVIVAQGSSARMTEVSREKPRQRRSAMIGSSLCMRMGKFPPEVSTRIWSQ